uniref:Uncharacterized protein n=1 Tax=Anguilla anguilla TaxID=7936 RepID=A0A0E9UZK1_ANGAN
MSAVFSTSGRAVLTSITPPAAMPSSAIVDYRWMADVKFQTSL